MCGLIAIAWTGAARDRVPPVTAASLRMLPRGPDGEGAWSDDGVSLAHRRLAIIDVDPRSHQPMHSGSDRYAIVFNGEIYNHRELRDDLEQRGVAFRTESDTEVLLELFAREGERMLPRLRGMFAIAIWDKKACRLFIARDPYGIKPLYYAETAHGVLVASQVKALLATGLVSREPDPIGQASFWLTGSVPEPHTWFRGARSLRAGHYAFVERGALQEPRCWWDIREEWRKAGGAELPADEVRLRVRNAVCTSVRAHLVSDVPVGIFLSGGIDSGALAGLVREAGSSLKAMTIAFHEFAGRHDDEAPTATRIAKHYGLDIHVRNVTKEEFLNDLPRIIDSIDQPSIDGVNTWYASKTAAELGIKVVVSGIGGDELFQGYGHFRSLPLLVGAWKRLSRIPGAMPLAEQAVSLQALRTGNLRWKVMPRWAQALPTAWLARRGLFSPDELASVMGTELAAVALKELDPVRWVESEAGELPADSRLAISQLESVFYLRNQLLRDSDWASMAHSVELRTPLVDAWLLRELSPVAAAFRRFPKKRLLAESPRLALPPEVLRREKSGFGIPVRQWLASEPGGPSEHALQSWAKKVAGAHSLL